jgi:hypothetical protein
MTTALEAATLTLNDLRDRREQLIGHSAKLAADRQHISYAAHTGDKTAKERLRKINDESILRNAELESIDAAIVEANARLSTAQRDEALQQDREQAKALQAALAKFKELGLLLDDAMADFTSASVEMKQVLEQIHNCGCATPSFQSYKVNADLAFKTAVQATPFWTQEFPFLAPGQRKTFRDLVTAWAGAIENNIAARLGTETKTEEKAA